MFYYKGCTLIAALHTFLNSFVYSLENPLELKYEIEYNVGDNLLELLKEVKLPVTDNITSHHVGKHNLVSDTIKSKELATTIFEDLQKECLDTTDSDGSQTME